MIIYDRVKGLLPLRGATRYYLGRKKHARSRSRSVVADVRPLNLGLNWQPFLRYPTSSWSHKAAGRGLWGRQSSPADRPPPPQIILSNQRCLGCPSVPMGECKWQFPCLRVVYSTVSLQFTAHWPRHLSWSAAADDDVTRTDTAVWSPRAGSGVTICSLRFLPRSLACSFFYS